MLKIPPATGNKKIGNPITASINNHVFKKTQINTNSPFKQHNPTPQIILVPVIAAATNYCPAIPLQSNIFQRQILLQKQQQQRQQQQQIAQLLSSRSSYISSTPIYQHPNSLVTTNINVIPQISQPSSLMHHHSVSIPVNAHAQQRSDLTKLFALKPSLSTRPLALQTPMTLSSSSSSNAIPSCINVMAHGGGENIHKPSTAVPVVAKYVICQFRELVLRTSFEN